MKFQFLHIVIIAEVPPEHFYFRVSLKKNFYTNKLRSQARYSKHTIEK